MMLNKEKGFTLIELLATLVILALLMVIIVPKVVATIDNTRKKTFENRLNGLIVALRQKQRELMMDSYVEKLIFEYENGIEKSDKGLSLNYSGEKPENGIIIIDEDGKIAIAIHDYTFCARKGYEDEEITITKEKLDDCNLEIEPEE